MTKFETEVLNRLTAIEFELEALRRFDPLPVTPEPPKPTGGLYDFVRPVPVEPDPPDRGDAHTPVDVAPAVADHVADRLEVDAALATLPPDFRAAVVLRDLCQLYYAEIADLLDVPIGTVRSRIARGRGHLADAIGHTRTGNSTGATDRPTTAP